MTIREGPLLPIFTLFSVFTFLIGAWAMDIRNVTDCYMRLYNYYVNNTYVFRTTNGNLVTLPCHDHVPVYSCWGRCDSSEIGDFRVPYKQSNHKVCTYGGRKLRTVRLRYCHSRHPDPYFTVVDATHCVCGVCDPESTSCEGLGE